MHEPMDGRRNENESLVPEADKLGDRLSQAQLQYELQEHARRIRELEAHLKALKPLHMQAESGSASARHELKVDKRPSLASSESKSAESGEQPSSPDKKYARAKPGGLEVVPGDSNRNNLTDGATSPKASSSKQRLGWSSKAQEGQDPYEQMWSVSKIDQKRMFDQDLLKSVFDKPHTNISKQASLFGSGLFGLLSMPFGPIGMAAGAIFGSIVGFLAGLLVEKRKRRTKLQESELEKKRLKSLVRWASERFHEDDEILSLIEMVTLEFKPMADIANGSKNARKLLMLLDQWISQKNVTRQLWVYMDHVLQQWRDLSRGDFLRSMLVFQTLTISYRYTGRQLTEQEHQFIRRMERLLEHKSVKSVMAHAQAYPTQGDKRVMECMVYADFAALHRSRSRSGLITPPSQERPSKESPAASDGDEHEREELQDDSSDEDVPGSPEQRLSSYQYTTTPRGSVMMREISGLQEDCKQNLVLKKPFFKSWEDYVDFDNTFKHKMPITLSEFELLLQKQIEPNNKNGWEVCVDRKDIMVSKVQTGPGSVMVRAWTTLPAVNIHVCFHLFFDISERMKWDKTFAGMSVVENNVQGSDIIYSQLRIPTVTTREFLQYRRVKLQEDGSILVVMRSADHHSVPETKGFIRVESYISGYVLRQGTDEEGNPVLKIFLMTCTDVKGMIPKWIVNILAPRKPGEWLESLRKAATDYQSAHPGCEVALIEKYREHFAKVHMYDFEPLRADGPNDQGAGNEHGALPASNDSETMASPAA